MAREESGKTNIKGGISSSEMYPFQDLVRGKHCYYTIRYVARRRCTTLLIRLHVHVRKPAENLAKEFRNVVYFSYQCSYKEKLVH